jgi:predicted TIM-barrel fold metal-dependent hydrolase
MDSGNDLLLKDYHPRPALVTEDHTPQKPRFRVVDAHNHYGRWEWDTTLRKLEKNTEWNSMIHIPDPQGDWSIQDLPAAIELMDEMNVACVVNLDGGWGDLLKQNLERYKGLYPDRFCIFAWVDWSQVDEPNFGEKWAKELERSVTAGAQGLKVFKSLGLRYRDRNGKLVMPDDPRLDPVWAKAGELDIPVLIHSSDPVAFFWPVDENNERWDELNEHPDWRWYGNDFPEFIQPINAQLRVVERHPETKFISAHCISYSENLGFVSKALDKYPNLYVDFAERIGELGRQPYSARKFFIQYADRILFGTDSFNPTKLIYQTYYRFLETEDEYFDYQRSQGRWRIYGVYLPDDVLQKIYYRNACKLIPGLHC